MNSFTRFERAGRTLALRLGWLGWMLFCAVTIAAQAPPPPPPAQGLVSQAAPTGSGAISGRVLLEDGTPAAGASIFLSVAGVTQSSGRNVTADEEGNFVIRDLAARAYRLNASVPGFVSDNVETVYYRVGDNVTLNLIKGGVITGRVTTSAGEPVIGVTVTAIRVKDGEGKPTGQLQGGRSYLTDDRGVYRIYGLRPGGYIVGTVRSSLNTSRPGLYDENLPVFHPSSTRDGASEVQVATGSVSSGIDIRYRYVEGRTISGKLSFPAEANGENSMVQFFTSISLIPPGGSNSVASALGYGTGGTGGYEMQGVVDGDYEIYAYRFNPANPIASLRRRISVRGADLTGIDLVLLPTATLAGQFVLEPLPKVEPAAAGVTAASDALKCPPSRRPAVEESLVRLSRLDVQTLPSSFGANLGTSEAAPDGKGAFKLSQLQAGTYRLLPVLPSDNWYLKSLTQTGTKTGGAAPAPAGARRVGVNPAPAAAPANSIAEAITIKAGENLSGYTVTLAEGAAALAGKLSPEHQKLGGRWRVHLLPAEAAAANDTTRYAQTVLKADGSFSFKQLAPGKYLVFAQALPEDESLEAPPRPLAWNLTERAKLRRLAEAGQQTITLETCQQVKDFTLKLSGYSR